MPSAEAFEELRQLKSAQRRRDVAALRALAARMYPRKWPTPPRSRS